MAKNEPWYWKQRDQWMYTPVGAGKNKFTRIVDEAGKPVKGEDARKLAYRHWSRMEGIREVDDQAAARPTNLSAAQVIEILDHYLVESQGRFTDKTFSDYRDSFTYWGREMPGLLVSKLTPGHIYKWFEKHPRWSEPTRATHLLRIRAALKWAYETGLIQKNPLARMAAPALGSRGKEAVCTPENYRAMIAGMNEIVRDPYRVMAETGARPGSILKARCKDVLVDRSAIEDWHHKRIRKTNKPIYIALSPTALEICVRRAAGRDPAAPLFTDQYDRPLTANLFSKRVRRLKRTLGLVGSVFPYSLRHALAVRMLRAGYGLHEVAAQLNNTPDMVYKHYGHAMEEHDEKVKRAAKFSMESDTLSPPETGPSGISTGEKNRLPETN